MSKKITENIFPLICGNHNCDTAYTFKDFIEVALFWGFILLESDSGVYLGFTCPRCIKTTLNKIKDIDSEQLLIQFETTGINVQKRYRGIHPKFRYYLLFSSNSNNEITYPDSNEDIFNLPLNVSPLIKEVKANRYAITEHQISQFTEKENSEGVKIFPRILNLNSVYKHTDLILQNNLNAFSILKKLLFHQYGELCAGKKDTAFYQASVYRHFPDDLTIEYFEKIFSTPEFENISEDDQNRHIVEVYKSLRNKLDFEVIYQKAFLHPLVKDLFLKSKTSESENISDVGNLNEALYDLEEEYGSLKQILTQNKKMMEVKRQIAEIARFETDVLLVGQTGTGKELFAQAIHQLSGKTGNFVPINCSSIPNDLFEKELFGSVKGAYTGAISDSDGAFLLAQNGTLFLDEFGELPLDMQPKILRAIENREIRPLGSDNTIHLDIKIIFATNRDLDQAVENELFRRDLFFRIKSPVFHLPPLSERIEDIPLLADHFRKIFNKKYNKTITELSPELISELKKKTWEGNVRELMKTVEMIILYSKGPVAHVLNEPRDETLDNNTDNSTKITDEEILYWMKKMNNNKSQVAKKLGVSYRTILRRSKKIL